MGFSSAERSGSPFLVALEASQPDVIADMAHRVVVLPVDTELLGVLWLVGPKLTGKKPRDVIRAGRVAQKPSLPADWPVGLQEQKLPSGAGISYLYQPGELEGGCRCATDPVWSLEVYQLGRSVTKQAEPVVYYL